jgi:hypothetical protein
LTFSHDTHTVERALVRVSSSVIEITPSLRDAARSSVRSELPWPDAVYCGMRLLCVGRHAYLSEHLCRYFRGLGADCAAAVGASDALNVAANYEPHVIVCDCDLITPTLLDEWAVEASLADVPLLAVSLTRRPEELPPLELLGVAGVLYLPALERSQVHALLAGAHRRRGVAPPIGWRAPVGPQSVSAR